MTTPRILDGDYEARVELDRLSEHPRNVRRGDVDLLSDLIDANGFVGAVIADRRTGHVLIGNHRLRTARKDGFDALPVIWVTPDDDDHAHRIMVGDNRGSDVATNDDGMLAELLAELEASPGGLRGTGFDKADLDRLLDSVGAAIGPSATDPDEEPLELPYTPRTRVGDVWVLGPHRIVCGDTRDPAVVATATDGALADLVFTSPPYNVGVEYASHDDETQGWDAYAGFLADALRGFLPSVGSGRAVCWNIGVSPKTFPHRQGVLLEAHGLEFVRQLVWQKVGVPVPSWYRTELERVARYFTPNYTHEIIMVFAAGDDPAPRPADAERALAIWVRRPFTPKPASELVLVYSTAKELEKGGSVRFDDTLEHDVFTLAQNAATIDIPTVTANSRTGAKQNLDRRARKAHPAPFPVTLPEAFMRHLADPGDLVLDPFMGAGATLLAAHRNGRVAAGVELDPAYVDLTCWRWQRLTGELPRRPDGEPVNFTLPVTADDAGMPGA